jgi:fatty acid-binding protein DegV
LKPCIEVKDGKMGVCKKYRGNLKDVLQQYVSERLADLESIDNRRIFITHSGIDADIEKAIYEQVKALDYFEEILITTASSTIATHCGPNTLGVLFIKK